MVDETIESLCGFTSRNPIYFYSAFVDSGDDEINDEFRGLANENDTRPEMRVTDASNQAKFVPI